MCGLSGVLLAPRARSAAERREIAAVFTRNLLANEERGREATGVAVIQSDGSWHLAKAPVPASIFVHDAEYRRVLASLDADTVMILGHTRLPTQGDPAHNSNNHPLQAGNVIGIHNGRVHNDDALAAHFHLSRAAEVDSEVIFHLLDRLFPLSPSGVYLDALTDTITRIEGSLAVLAVDLRRPDRLVLIKSGSPLSLHHDLATGTLHLSSRYLFLRRTFGRASQTLDEMLPPSCAALFESARLAEGHLRVW